MAAAGYHDEELLDHHKKSSRSTMSITIHESQMSGKMQRELQQVALQAANKYTQDNDIVHYIKKEFDIRHGGYWDCVVGFAGHNVQYEANSYIHFSVGNTRITLFKSA
ncbi:uncharacterized protein LOC127164260 [Labeo rohita]|uniref:uncharacterized protein LOC127164260 n=1 Tax=Labeo rohita TaxID=84645 RepID=UPI0021E21B93|nr:uncharacterized protein LOC127164260 [Labeo rohita]